VCLGGKLERLAGTLIALVYRGPRHREAQGVKVNKHRLGGRIALGSFKFSKFLDVRDENKSKSLVPSAIDFRTLHSHWRRASSRNVVMADIHQNVFNQEDSRYINIERELKEYLREFYAGKVADDYDFRVRVRICAARLVFLTSWLNAGNRTVTIGGTSMDPRN
jgi:hypothetical protein